MPGIRLSPVIEAILSSGTPRAARSWGMVMTRTPLSAPLHRVARPRTQAASMAGVMMMESSLRSMVLKVRSISEPGVARVW